MFFFYLNDLYFLYTFAVRPFGNITYFTSNLSSSILCLLLVPHLSWQLPVMLSVQPRPLLHLPTEFLTVFCNSKISIQFFLCESYTLLSNFPIFNISFTVMLRPSSPNSKSGPPLGLPLLLILSLIS